MCDALGGRLLRPCMFRYFLLKRFSPDAEIEQLPQFTGRNCLLATNKLQLGLILSASSPLPGSNTCLPVGKMLSISIDKLAQEDIISDIFVNETNVNLLILTKQTPER